MLKSLLISLAEWWYLWALPALGLVNGAWTDPTSSGDDGGSGIDMSTNQELPETVWDRVCSDLQRLGGTDGFAHISGVGFKNVGVAASVAGSALTVTIQGRKAALSSSNRALFAFRNATLNTPAIEYVEASADLTIVVPSGGELGLAANKRTRIYVGVTNDGGTLRAVLFNTQGTSQLYALPDEAALHSAAAIGVGSDSAGVLYGSAVTASKALVWVGYIEITLVTPGTWDADAIVEQTRGAGLKWHGMLAQPVIISETGAVATGTNLTPSDDTIPQNTEGDQYMSQAITPIGEMNFLEIDVLAQVSDSVQTDMIMGLFQDATANALAASMTRSPTATINVPLPLKHVMRAGTTASTTFKIRIGSNQSAGAATITFNGQGGSRMLGGVINSFIQIKEIFA